MGKAFADGMRHSVEPAYSIFYWVASSLANLKMEDRHGYALASILDCVRLE